MSDKPHLARRLNEIEAGSSRLYQRDFLGLSLLADYVANVDTICTEVERLQAVDQAARAFVRHHQRGQPGTSDTLYPMTYAVQDQWHTEWDRRLEALIAACQT
jgi:hypothetical protein